MRRAIAALAVLVLLVGLAVPAEAGWRHHHGGGGIAGPLILGGAILGSAIILSQPRTVYHYPAPAPYPVYVPEPRVSYPVTPGAVVEYPHGKYVLYGDGVYVPYQWVWHPKPSVPPVPPPPPAAPPAPPVQ